MRRTAREFFEAVRSAAQDAERCKIQLVAIEHSAQVGSSCGYGERTSSGGGNVVERRTVAYVDQSDRLDVRMEADYRLIDRACAILYGNDQQGGGGLCKANPRDSNVWADVLWWRFCAAASWQEVAKAVGYTVRPCQEFQGRALAWIDQHRFCRELIEADDLFE